MNAAHSVDRETPGRRTGIVVATCVASLVAICASSGTAWADEATGDDLAVFWADVGAGAAWAPGDADGRTGAPGLDLSFAVEARPWRYLGFETGFVISGIERDPSEVVEADQLLLLGQLGMKVWPIGSGWFQPYLAVGGMVGTAELTASGGSQSPVGDAELGSESAVAGGGYASLGFDFVIPASIDDDSAPRKVLLGIEATVSALRHDLRGFETTLGLIGDAPRTELVSIQASFGLGL